MRRHVAFGILLLVFGCASTETSHVGYDASTGQTTYQSNKVLVGNVTMSTGLASGQRVMMQVFAACDGRTCTPSQFDVAFLNDSDRDLNLDYRRIQIVAGGKTLDWEDPARLTEPTYYSVPRGEFVRLTLSAVDFRALATDDNVQIIFGLTGTSPFRVSFDRRAPLREFLGSLSHDVG